MSLTRSACRLALTFKLLGRTSLLCERDRAIPVLCLSSAMSSESTRLLDTKHVGFLGSGQMAQALAKGFLSAGILKGEQVIMADVFSTSSADAHLFEPIKRLQDVYGIEYVQMNDVMAKKSDIIFICVKPHIVRPTLKEISHVFDGKLVISVAAGVTLEQLSQVVLQSTRLIRIMPNTPCLVGAGTAFFACGPSASAEDVLLTKVLCSSIFNVFEEIPETMFDAATGISGCGPAYVISINCALENTAKFRTGGF
ncbi:hypothetical protein CRM22_000589 [Opisthorchis felineus]|uniref:Pyrroline-5-carboxylate reductase catalytic N-terminal domain-containing protein n=1 Tax=Opisthorchis felineus TaxID=147828 RepID=A0A4S2MEM9_OPIFE|nr:hypothetical protein CRM22_000589 [Opisthorchis felineus]TGZ75082.1 hypothetical protein CRM22_000589 [Opisthorchis felineus]